jgi:hypothetical protein
MNSIDRWDSDGNLLHAAVLRYLKFKWPIVPLWWMDSARCACGKPNCGSNSGKHPIPALVRHGVNDATLNESNLNQLVDALSEGKHWRRTGTYIGPRCLGR